jgi:hypothetical protein
VQKGTNLVRRVKKTAEKQPVSASEAKEESDVVRLVKRAESIP